MESLRDYLSDEQKRQYDKKVSAVMPAGHGVFHHPLTVHGSYANHSDRPRRAFVLNVFADGTLSDSGEELLTGVPPISKGEKMQGQYFPVIFDVNKI